jgi:outer membrane lipoprotein-sorting protein
MRIFAFLLALLLALPAWSANPAVPAPADLAPKERADIARIESYLNDLKSVAADFTQISDSGEFRHGKIAIQRPGKMRVTYAAPDKDFMVADGSFVYMWDDELEQQSQMPVGSSIAEFILRDPVRLNGDVTITRFARYPAKIELSLVSTNDPGEGELTLIFEDKPLQLRQWRVLDAQGRTTGINLENMREDVVFPSNTFSFVSPNLGKTPRSRN